MTETPRTEGARASIDEAIRIHRAAEQLSAKLKLLRSQTHQSLEVAASLASDLDWEERLELTELLRDANVHKRSIFTQAPATTFYRPGRAIRRPRRGSGLPWPADGTPVVYLLLDNEATVIYVGKSCHLRSRMDRHRAKPWAQSEIIVCETEAQALQLEGDLIFQHQPTLNEADRNRRRHSQHGRPSELIIRWRRTSYGQVAHAVPSAVFIRPGQRRLLPELRAPLAFCGHQAETPPSQNAPTCSRCETIGDRLVSEGFILRKAA